MIDRNWSCIDLQAKTNMEAGKCSFSALNWLRNAIKWPNSHNYDTPIPPVVLCLPFNALRWRTSCMVVWFEFLVTNTFIIWNVRWAMSIYMIKSLLCHWRAKWLPWFYSKVCNFCAEREICASALCSCKDWATSKPVEVALWYHTFPVFADNY